MKGLEEMKKKVISCILLVMVLGATTINAGDGQGDGKSQLQLEASVPESGAKEVAVDTTIDMKFSNNVINMKVSDNNLTCFKLLDADDNALAIEVIIGDDQIDPTVKNDVSVKPLELLEENQSYRLVVSGEMMAKNGTQMGEDRVIEFDTVSTEKTTNIPVIITMVCLGIAIGYFVSRKRARPKS